jgi:hypothetical protein
MSNIQVNMRCPVTAKDLVQDVCTRLRSDPRFEERLRTFLANEGANQEQDVRDAIADLQHRVRMLEYDKKYPRAGQKAPTEATEAPAAALETGDRTDLLETADSAPADAPGDPVPGPWKNGTRLTANGRAEIDRRIAAGERDKDIAKALEVTRQAINARRKKKRG